MNVIVVKFSDGGHNLYYVDGVWERNIQHDEDLFDRLAGHTLESKTSIWIEPVDDDEPEPFWNVEGQETLDDLIAHIKAHPQIVDEGDLDIIEGLVG